MAMSQLAAVAWRRRISRRGSSDDWLVAAPPSRSWTPWLRWHLESCAALGGGTGRADNGRDFRLRTRLGAAALVLWSPGHRDRSAHGALESARAGGTYRLPPHTRAGRTIDRIAERLPDESSGSVRVD